ncbi:GyrI-like domain-containing protein [Emticicia sp. CRIBPO]|uniref:GyrI-like domain-containing protein n=1 Tax=Emticicia sp. CRIBPO TaxID=2683258 RepID=UPI001411F5E0|nr:GyrI-like domain-containing protein [Emticicia sp. CRIBPO]NBA87546.1 GyrI-like domain-containing protein [Emticicia sp. CRIBPO]
MEPRIETLSLKKLVGISLQMSMADNKTAELWRSFMPRRQEIKNRLSPDMFSLQVYESAFDFNPGTVFTKWAAVEVPDFSAIPENMASFEIPEGLYAVFLHKGASPTAARTFGYIFGVWFPSSDYELDHRPHFEILGEKYKNNDPDSEEEIWLPVKLKTS